jgi:hypothetical protein
MSDKKFYEVGYRKPPTSTQFKPGQSGNPKGRRRDEKTTAKILQKVLEERVSIRLGHRRLNVTKLEAMIFANVTRASRGNYRALKHILTTDDRLNPPPPVEGQSGVLILPRAQFIEVMRRQRALEIEMDADRKRTR